MQQVNVTPKRCISLPLSVALRSTRVFVVAFNGVVNFPSQPKDRDSRVRSTGREFSLALQLSIFHQSA